MEWISSTVRFLKTFFSISGAPQATPASPTLEASDRLSRFLIQSNQFSARGVSYRAFIPPSNLELSVFHTTGQSDAEVWTTGRIHVADPRGRRPYGRADIEVVEMFSRGLRTRLDEPPPQHWVAEGWSCCKDEQLDLAHELAASSRLVLLGSVPA